jgi:hypothetical protein
MCHPQSAFGSVAVHEIAGNFVYSDTDVIGIADSGCGTVLDMVVAIEVVALQNLERWLEQMKKPSRNYSMNRT